MKKFPKHFKTEIETLYRSGCSLNKIAKVLELNKNSVFTFIKKQPYYNKTVFPVVSESDSILELYNKGLKPTEIANQLDLNSISVNSFLQKLGITFKPKVHNETYFSSIDTSNKAYFLGFIAADGSLVDNKSGSIVLTISIHQKDIEILQKFKEEVQCDHEIKYLKQRGNMIRLSFHNPTIIKDLLALGIHQRKTFTLGNILQNIPCQFRDAFIIGYFDGDGSVSKTSLNGKCISIRGTEELLKGIQEHLGFGRIFFNKTYIYQASSIEHTIKFFSLYNNCDFYLKRKYEKFDECRIISSPYSRYRA